jgi:hypothetical protein
MAVYELGHKLAIYNKTNIYVTYENTRKLYYTEMAILTGVSILYSPILAPMHILQDIINIEAKYNGHYPKQTKAYSFINILFH